MKNFFSVLFVDMLLIGKISYLCMSVYILVREKIVMKNYVWCFVIREIRDIVIFYLM